MITSMNRLLCLLGAAAMSLSATSATSAQLISIDFNVGLTPVAYEDNEGTAFFPGQTSEWNVLDVAEGAGNFAIISTTLVADTLFFGDFSFADSIAFHLNTEPGSYQVYFTGDSDDPLRNDVTYITSGSIGWKITGLAPNSVYNLAFYGQRQGGGFNNPSTWTIGAVSLSNWQDDAATAGAVFGNTDGTQGAESVFADASGTISGTWTMVAGQNFAGWSGLQIQFAQPADRPTVTPPRISPGASVYAGTPVELTAAAVGTPPLQYQWRIDTGSGPVHISGATATNLVVDTTSLLGAVQYDVVVSNAAGATTSASAILNVNPASAPLMLADITPTSSTLPVGGQVTFSTRFDGTRPIAYQWQIDRGAGYVTVPGATNSTLILANVQSADAGTYRLRAANSVGEQMTSAASLTVDSEVALSIFTGPGSHQGLDLQGNFELAEYYGGTDHGPLPIGDAVFEQSDRTGGASFQGNTPSFGDAPDAIALGQIIDNVLYSQSLEFYIDTTPGTRYKLQLIFHEVFFSTVGSRVMTVQAGDKVLIEGLDLVKLEAFTTRPRGAALVYPFVGDGSPMLITITVPADNAALNALTLEVLPPTSTSTVSIERSGQGYRIGGIGAPGGSYQVLRAAQVTGPWQSIGSFTANAAGAGSYVDTSPPAGQAFYRLAQP
jgi:hypothetical protein